MNRANVAAVAIGLAATFIVSVAAGAFIARQLNSGTTPPAVAVASPSAPPPVQSLTATLSPAPTPTALAPTATAVMPTVTATPVATPTPGATPTPALDPATAEDFAAQLAAALNSRDVEYLVSRLHPATTDRYGVTQCRRHIKGLRSSISWEIQSSAGPAAWDYVSDGLTTTISDAWTVTVRQQGADPEIRELHFAPVDVAWRWFTDCGDPT
jgi:hypothetical protein